MSSESKTKLNAEAKEFSPSRKSLFSSGIATRAYGARRSSYYPSTAARAYSLRASSHTSPGSNSLLKKMIARERILMEKLAKYEEQEEQTNTVQESYHERSYHSQSKQNVIFDVHNALFKKFGHMRCYKHEVDCNANTYRVYAKDFEGLMVLEPAIEKLMQHSFIDVEEISFHKTLKNKHQKKGILVLIKVGTQEQTEMLLDIFYPFNQELEVLPWVVHQSQWKKLQKGDFESRRSQTTYHSKNAWN